MDGASGGYGRGERSDSRRRDEDRQRQGHRSRNHDRNSYRSNHDYGANGDRSRSRTRDEFRDSRDHRHSRDDDRRDRRQRDESSNGRGREDRYSDHYAPQPQLPPIPPPVAPDMRAVGVDRVDAFVGDRGFGGGFVDRGPGNGRGGGNNCDRGLGGEPFRSGGGPRGRGPSSGGHSGGRGGRPGWDGRGGRGGGGGRGRGAGGGPRRSARERREDLYDLVQSRPIIDGRAVAKQAVLDTNSRQVRLRSNFYRVDSRPDWAIFHYRVDFLPEETDTRIKKRLFRAQATNMGAYVFDGSSLYVSQRLTPDPMILQGKQENGVEMQLTIRLVAQLVSTDIMYLQIFNIIVRKCLESMQLEEMGRHYYDRRQAIRIEAHHLELWPGYKTSMRSHENDILLGVEITHKVLRLDSCLQVINNLRFRHDGQKKIHDELIGCIVMTIYNRKTYRVDDIDVTRTPQSTFEMQGREVTFVDYFREKYNIAIHDNSQPLLVSRPKKKDFHRGMTGPISLIPELCQMTGLTDEMRSNNQLMKALATHLHTDPNRRIGKLRDFIQNLTGNADIQTELTRWGLRFEQNLVEFNGHVIPKENIFFGNNQIETPNDKYDWSHAFRSKQMLSVVNLTNWVIIVPSRDANAVDKLLNNMQRVATPLNFKISKPREVRRINETRPAVYANTVDQVMDLYKDQIEMLFVILPKQTNDIYSAVKKRTCVEFGVPSQCFVAKNAYNDRGLMSICTKLVIQMNAKLGGEPWKVHIPLKDLMIVGFDAYHCGKRKGASVGAMTATISNSYGRYFSTISYHNSRDDLSEKMGGDFTKCLHAYREANKSLPRRIIMYRDGVGDGQLKYVYKTELEEIQKQLEAVYEKAGIPLPKFTFIVVTKRINTRIFGAERNCDVNPEPGTVADDVITLPERYDFYLIAQFARQGTVSPVSYNILKDTSGLDADKIQKLTFKLCHLYFNWSGTVTVPAPCQYAHKLAYLTGLSLGGASKENLSNKLYYL